MLPTLWSPVDGRLSRGLIVHASAWLFGGGVCHPVSACDFGPTDGFADAEAEQVCEHCRWCGCGQVEQGGVAACSRLDTVGVSTF